MAAVGEDDTAWERAIAAATKNTSGPKTLALDGAVQSSTGRLPSPALLERFAASLEELSVAGAHLSSLAGLPRLPSLRRLSLPDNRLSAAALAAVAEACGATLRHLDLGNNRFAEVEELEPLAKLRVEVLVLYQCPVSKVKGYREEVFALIPSLKYLDGVDAEGNQRLETDDEGNAEEEDKEDGEEGQEEDGVEAEAKLAQNSCSTWRRPCVEGDEEDGEDGEGDDDGEEEEVGPEQPIRLWLADDFPCAGKSWPQVVGLTANEAKKRIKRDCPELNCEVVSVNQMLTCDYRSHRIRVMADRFGKVVEPPSVG